MFSNVRKDFRRALRANQHQYTLGATLRELMNPGTQAILCYRFGRWADAIRIPGIRHLLRVLHFILQYFFGWRVGIFIPIRATIEPGFCIHTWGGGVFLPACPIGRNLTIVGGGVVMDYEVRKIGEDVSIGPGTKVMGKVSLGDRVRTAPNSVVKTDVPDDCVVVGNPGRVIGPIPPISDAVAKRFAAAHYTGTKTDEAD